MKSVLSVLCCLALAFQGEAQGAKKFTSLDEIDGHFEEMSEAAMLKITKDRLAALESYIGDKGNKDKTDLGKAKAMAAQLKVAVAVKSETNPAALKAAHAQLLGTLENEDIRQGIELTSDTVDRLVELDDVAGAKAAWTAVSEKFADHPQATQIQGLVKSRSADLEIIGTEPKAFTVKDTKDVEQSLEKYKGKVLFLDFWATWCGPCRAELPNVISAYKKYHSKGFEVLGVSLDKEDKTVLDKFLEKNPEMVWPQIYDGKFWKAELAQLYGVQSIPATYLIDQSGKVYRVGLRGKALDKAIEKLLAKPPAK
jgi:thiol-disulfide isomerase/thioredoxin